MSEESTAPAAVEAPAPKPKPRVLIIGSQGMLGSDLLAETVRRGWQVTSPWREDLDITHMPHLEKLRKHDYGQFDYVLNCAGYTQVDKAESEFMQAQMLNGVAPGALAVICQSNGWRLLHVSTDYVFDGETDGEYDEDRPCHPVNAYGKSKRFGEIKVLTEHEAGWVVRTSWLYGKKGKSFPRSILNAHKEGKELRVVSDQFGRPTCTKDFARTLADFVELAPAGGVYHAAGPEAMSWFDMAKATMAANGEPEAPITPIATEDYPTPARRPRRTVLALDKLLSLGIAPMRPVAESLAEFVAEVRSVSP